MSDFSMSDFWEKISVASGCRKLVLNALICFYALTDADSPAWVKAILVAALAYFINPLDPLGPDPFIWVDDIAVLSSALAALSGHIEEHHKQQARDKLDSL